VVRTMRTGPPASVHVSTRRDVHIASFAQAAQQTDRTMLSGINSTKMSIAVPAIRRERPRRRKDRTAPNTDTDSAVGEPAKGQGFGLDSQGGRLAGESWESALDCLKSVRECGQAIWGSEQGCGESMSWAMR
jgi:hypothetical protein